MPADLPSPASDPELRPVTPGADQSGVPGVDERYRVFVDALPDMVSLAEADGTLVYVNHAYASYFGKSPAEMLGASLYAWVQTGRAHRLCPALEPWPY